MSIWRWARLLLAAGVVYLGWAIGFTLLEQAWSGPGGGGAVAGALAVSLAAGAIARLLERSRRLPLLAVAVVALDTLGALALGAVSGPLGRDLLLRTVPLVALLGAVLLTSAVAARRSPRAAG